MSLLVMIPLMSWLDLWSFYFTQVQLTTITGDKTLPSITIAELPPGVAIVQAIMIFKYRTIENTNTAVNGVSGAQNIQAQKSVDGSWITGIALNGNECSVPASTRDTGDVIMGTDDISEQVPENGAEMNFQWASGQAADDELYLNDVQVGLRIWFTV